MSERCNCWRCGGALPDLLLPLARHEECPHCRAQLHVCRMCGFFDPVAPQQCREPVAEPVADKQRANFCGYFRLNPRAWNAAPAQDAAARRELDALFGDAAGAAAPESAGTEDAARDALDALFRK
ncbi:MAG: hypothetical protein R3F42_09920 [Pseudomonadota bacterium]